MILHGSRSGLVRSVADEFGSTVAWAEEGAPYHNPDGSIDLLGWNATIGEDIVGQHLGATSYGWNARRWSASYLAIEFAQANLSDPITDPMIEAFCWWFLTVGRVIWPNLPAEFPTHAELDRQLAHPDGKTDCFVDGSALRTRIAMRLAKVA